MDQHAEIIDLLNRIEQNQAKALELQSQHFALAQANSAQAQESLDRSDQSVAKSLELQRISLARQAQIRNVTLPVIVVLLVLLAYLMVGWRVF